MNFQALMTIIGDRPYFDLPTLLQLTGEKRQSVIVQLSRFQKQGKISPLRRGMYVFAGPFRKKTPAAVFLANRIYSPSYLSFHWALWYYDIIPEHVFEYTNVTTRVPRTFKNEFGVFSYTHIKQSCFGGYRTAELDGSRFLVAEPEKALADLWYIGKGEWTVERMAEMRFQNFKAISSGKLAAHIRLYGHQRLVRALQNWRHFIRLEKKGTKTL